MQTSESVGGTFGRAWDLLIHNWVIIVPGIVIGLLSSLVLLIAPVFAGGSAALLATVAALIVLAAVLLTVAYTTGMAASAWETGKARYADGAHALAAEGLSVLVAMVLVVLGGLAAIVLAVPTFFLSLPIFAMCVLYVFSSVIVGGRNAPAALAESASMAVRNWPVTLALVILLALVSWLGRTIGDALTFIPLVGSLLGTAVPQIVAAYTALVVVGEYLKLRPVEPAAARPGAP